MRILMLSWEYPPHVVGGLGSHVTELVPALSRLGVDIHLITPALAGGPSLEEAGLVSVHRIAPPEAYGGDVHEAAREVNVVLERYSRTLWSQVGAFDVVHAHDWLVAFAACGLRRSLDVPLVVTFHATERGRGGGHLVGPLALAIHSTESQMAGEAERVIVTSRFMLGEAQAEFGLQPDRVDVVPNGVDCGRLARYERMDLSAFRRSFALDDQRLVLYVGRLEYQKGVHTLLEAVPEVWACCPDVRFVIAGEGGELDNLRRQAEALGIESGVLFAGFVNDEDRDRLYHVADVTVVPSLYEPFGIVALEAMAAKCPVVASDVGGLSEVVRCHENGLKVSPGDPKSVAWGIKQMLVHPDAARSMAAAGYEVVREEYNWHRVASLTKEVYARVTGGDNSDHARPKS